MKTRKRLYGRQWELARICVPIVAADFILSKRKELREGKAHDVYEALREQHRYMTDYAAARRLQYLYEMFWSLSSKTPIMVQVVGRQDCVPTDLLEHEDWSWGKPREQDCKVLSLRVRLEAEQVECVREMMSIVEREMKSFRTDFYLHDMRIVARSMGRHPLLWTVSTSHTFMEEMDAEGEANYWVEHIGKPAVHELVYGHEDGTYMGSALRVACSDKDLYFYHDGGQLHRVSRERFQKIHDQYVQRATAMAREKLAELKKVA